MKHDIFNLFASKKSRALRYEREAHYAKVKECMVLKAENDELWELSQMQRLALDAIRQGHAQDMAEMTESLRRAHAQLAAADAERDRYKEALRRAFPPGVTA